MKQNNTATPAAPQISQRAALARLANVTAPRPAPASFCYVACTFAASNAHSPARELPARFSFDATNDTQAREVVEAVQALGYTVKSAVFIGENRSFIPLILASPETDDAAARHPANRSRRVMGRAAPLYTEVSAA